MCRKAADWIEDVARTENIECKYVRVPGYLYPAKDSWIHNKTLEKELEVFAPCNVYLPAITNASARYVQFENTARACRICSGACIQHERLECVRQASHRAGMTEVKFADLQGDPSCGGIHKCAIDESSICSQLTLSRQCQWPGPHMPCDAWASRFGLAAVSRAG